MLHMVLLLAGCILAAFLVAAAVLAYLVIVRFIRKYEVIDDSEGEERYCSLTSQTPAI